MVEEHIERGMALISVSLVLAILKLAGELSIGWISVLSPILFLLSFILIAVLLALLIRY